MPERSVTTGGERFALRDRILRDIRELRLLRLPHPRLIMLHERAMELCAALEQGLRTVAGGDPALADNIGPALEGLCGLLRDQARRAADELDAVEGLVGYMRLPGELATLHKRAGELAAEIAGDGQDDRFASRWTELADAVDRLGSAARRACAFAEPRIEAGVGSIDRVFSMLERNPGLAPVRREAQLALTQRAHEVLGECWLFDKNYYTGEAAAGTEGVSDLLAHYLSAGETARPHPFFDPAHYRQSYPEVTRLRYFALEHFNRYGEVLYYDPGPDFDTLYYLEANDDVLQAGIPPLRHFVGHGLPEGRSPSPRALGFFSDRFIGASAARPAILASPAELEGTLGRVRSWLETAHGGPVPVLGSLDGDLPDVLFFGATGATLLRDGKALSALTGRSAVYVGDDPQADLDGLPDTDTFPLDRLCAFTTDGGRFLRWQESERPRRLLHHPFADPHSSLPILRALLDRAARNVPFSNRRYFPETAPDNGPCISVVSIIYRKAKEMISFLQGLNGQNLARPYEVVLVDDASPDDAVDEVERWLREIRSAGLLNRFMTVRVLRNESNRGNCVSRNRGIEAAKAEIVLVADGDVHFSTGSLGAHLRAYRNGDCDAVIGFSLFDMDGEMAEEWVTACEADGRIVERRLARPLVSGYRQMVLDEYSVFNFITRNVSFRKSTLEGNYFDEAFGYSSRKDSGYGNEDFEMGARLYFSGKRIRFIKGSVGVHIRHRDSAHNDNKLLANIRNWNRLLDKHPDLPRVDRQYCQWRTRSLLAKGSGQRDSDEVRTLRARLANGFPPPVSIRLAHPLRIFTRALNAPYQRELFKLGHEFLLAAEYGGWDHSLRPLPRMARTVSAEDAVRALCDAAILDFDGRVAQSGSEEARRLDELLRLAAPLPRVAVCHGLPPGPAADGLAALRERLAGVHVICDSQASARLWGFEDCSVILPGLTPLDFSPGRCTGDCLTLPEEAFAQDGEADEWLSQIQARLAGRCEVKRFSPPPVYPGYAEGTNERGLVALQGCAAYLRDFSLFLNPCAEQPLPRVLIEAMTTGAVPVVRRTEDAEAYIRDGVNGFMTDSPEEMADRLLLLKTDVDLWRRMSRAARLDAMDIFNVDRFLAAWSEVLHRLVPATTE
ncbi:MAG: glycosyltransferase [Deltaproteobacteria bacterium]|nr:glycosyltransferase [Deltaproteobacteria bacterium]